MSDTIAKTPPDTTIEDSDDLARLDGATPEDLGHGPPAADPPPAGPSTALEVTAATPISDVVMADEDKIPVRFDPMDLPEWDTDAVKMLSHNTRIAYYNAKGRLKSRTKQQRQEDAAAEAEAAIRSPLLGVIGGTAIERNKLRERAGWHQTWKRQDELEQALAAGYVHIRRPKRKDGRDLQEEPGKETGEIVRRETRWGERDTMPIYGLEIPEKTYRLHLLAMSYKSKTAGKEKKRVAQEYLKEELGVDVKIGPEAKEVEQFYHKRATGG